MGVRRSAALTRLVGGWLADRWRRDREVAAAGYALSAACKLGLLGAGGVEGTVHAEGESEPFGRTAERDQGVARGRAQPLA